MPTAGPGAGTGLSTPPATRPGAAPVRSADFSGLWHTTSESTAAVPQTTAATTPRHSQVTNLGKLVVVLTGFVFVISWSSDPSTQLGLASALAAALLIDGSIARRALADAEIAVLPDVGCEADDAPEAVVAVTGLKHPALLRSGLGGSDPHVRLLGDEVGTITLPRQQRGVKRSIVLDLITVGPLGLVRSGMRRRILFSSPLLVWPCPSNTGVEWPPMTARSLATDPISLTGDELVRGIRPYVRGDSPRRVHWHASAHHGQMMVTECDGLGIVVVRIVVQLAETTTGNEWAVARAAWMAHAVLARGWRLELITRQPRHLPSEDTPLSSPFSTLPSTVLWPSAMRPLAALPTVSSTERITARHQLRRLLATATSGPLDLPHDHILTRMITPSGDEWR